MLTAATLQRPSLRAPPQTPALAPPLIPRRQISKLVTHGPDRAGALAGMRRALDAYVIRGVQHNAPLLRSVLDVPQFVAGAVSTAFLAEHYPTPEASAPERLPLSDQQRDQLLALAAMLWVGREQRLSGGGPLEVRCRAVGGPGEARAGLWGHVGLAGVGPPSHESPTARRPAREAAHAAPAAGACTRVGRSPPRTPPPPAPGCRARRSWC